MDYPLISIILVGFAEIEYKFEKTLSSISKQTYPNLEIILIWSQFPSNLRSKNKLRDLINDIQIPVHFYAFSRNLGYAKGNNIGTKHANGKFLMILNTDVEFKPDLIQKLFNHYKFINSAKSSLSKSLILMPRICNPTGTVEYSRRSINFLGMSNMDFSKSKKVRRTMILSGCAFLILKSDFNLLHGFDEKYFMYREDIDFSIKALRNQIPIYVDNSLKLWHLKTDKEYSLNHFKYYYIERNRLIFSFENSKNKIAMLIAQLLFEPIHIIFAIINSGFLKIRARIYKDIIWNWKWLKLEHGKENSLFDRNCNFGGLSNQIKTKFFVKLLNLYSPILHRMYWSLKIRKK